MAEAGATWRTDLPGGDVRTGFGHGIPLVQAGIIVAAVVVLGVRAWACLPFIEDDALISLRYAQRLLDGHGLTWTDGWRVEGYSNFLWVMLNALLGGCGVDLVTSARVLGYLGMSAAIAAVVFASRPARVIECFPALIGALTIALAYPVAVWTIGGLEQPLVAGLLAWAIVLAQPILEGPDVRPKAALAPSLLLGLLCLTRPDGPIFAAAITLSILLVRGTSRLVFRVIAALLGLPVLLTTAQIVFRLAYYGEWVPNTALVKITPSLHHLKMGGSYLFDGLLALGPLSWLAGLFLLIGLFTRPHRPFSVLLAVSAGAWAVYVAVIGGDVFPAWRHGIPLVMMMAMAIVRGVAWLRPRLVDSGRKGAAVLIAACLLAWYVHEQRSAAKKTEWMMNAGWQWDGQALGLMLKTAFAEQAPLLAVSSAGSLPYWSELPAIDMLGLNDYYLPRHPPPDLGSGLLGHELGDGRYVLERRPDLVVFHGGGGRADGIFRGERQMQALPEFARLYTLARFAARGPRQCEARIWVRRDSEKIGIRRGATEIVVPAYLLNGESDTVAYLDATGGFVVSATRRQPAVIRDLLVPPGRWRVQAAAAGPVEITMSISDGGGAGATGVLTSGPAPEFSAPDEVRLDITVTPAADGPVEVRELRIVAAGQSP